MRDSVRDQVRDSVCDRGRDSIHVRDSVRDKVWSRTLSLTRLQSRILSRTPSRRLSRSRTLTLSRIGTLSRTMSRTEHRDKTTCRYRSRDRDVSGPSLGVVITSTFCMHNYSSKYVYRYHLLYYQISYTLLKQHALARHHSMLIKVATYIAVKSIKTYLRFIRQQKPLQSEGVNTIRQLTTDISKSICGIHL